MLYVLPVVTLFKISASRLREAPDMRPLQWLLGKASFLQGLPHGIVPVYWRSAA